MQQSYYLAIQNVKFDLDTEQMHVMISTTLRLTVKELKRVRNAILISI